MKSSRQIFTPSVTLFLTKDILLAVTKLYLSTKPSFMSKTTTNAIEGHRKMIWPLTHRKALISFNYSPACLAYFPFLTVCYNKLQLS